MSVFDEIIAGNVKSWKVWENDNYLAFLTPFPNTPGVTVVIPKQNQGEDIFALSDEQYSGLLLAAKEVANLLKARLNVHRVAMIFEGTGVKYVHAKLYPLHGILAAQTDVQLSETEFSEEYDGHISTIEGPKMDDEQLDAIQAQITGVI